MFYKKYSGFSLIEIVICVAIVSIIYFYTIPYFHQYMAQEEIKKVQKLLIYSNLTAKSHASTYRANVVICSTDNGEQCQKTQWHTGLLIFQDTNQNKQIDSNEKIILYEKTKLKYGTLDWRGTLASPHLTFMAKHDGLPIGSNGSFFYCSFHNLPNKRIILSKMGHIRIENSKNC